jgi:hypothetical protein
MAELEVKFENIKDDNGTSLKSYAEVLIEKAASLGFVTIAIMASKERNILHVQTNADGSISGILAKLSKEMANNRPN